MDRPISCNIDSCYVHLASRSTSAGLTVEHCTLVNGYRGRPARYSTNVVVAGKMISVAQAKSGLEMAGTHLPSCMAKPSWLAKSARELFSSSLLTCRTANTSTVSCCANDAGCSWLRSQMRSRLRLGAAVFVHFLLHTWFERTVVQQCNT